MKKSLTLLAIVLCSCNADFRRPQVISVVIQQSQGGCYYGMVDDAAHFYAPCNTFHVGDTVIIRKK
jgi:hypothetical protein